MKAGLACRRQRTDAAVLDLELDVAAVGAARVLDRLGQQAPRKPKMLSNKNSGQKVNLLGSILDIFPGFFSFGAMATAEWLTGRKAFLDRKNCSSCVAFSIGHSWRASLKKKTRISLEALNAPKDKDVKSLAAGMFPGRSISV